MYYTVSGMHGKIYCLLRGPVESVKFQYSKVKNIFVLGKTRDIHSNLGRQFGVDGAMSCTQILICFPIRRGCTLDSFPRAGSNRGELYIKHLWFTQKQRAIFMMNYTPCLEVILKELNIKITLIITRT